MAKATTIREALKRWETENSGEEISEAKQVSLAFQFPPIEKMDSSLDVLTNCEKLSLSTNMIDRITGLTKLRNLKILALGRNRIKNFTGLDALANSLEQLWISYNFIERLRTVLPLKNLRILYMAHNLVKEWEEIDILVNLPNLKELIFVGNPLEELYVDKVEWFSEVKVRLPNLEKLDSNLLL
ncbi:hypothetical protein PR048_031489 [Dryococelus australis]|uniref:Dynein light chain 1, axonemal n=1 Tax=Dryococelus australis TaxID=614101 RepID=A0ABQ9G841_9NEOP|nr:hypothetical protein PR048_031489 [Dryococelus australis]